MVLQRTFRPDYAAKLEENAKNNIEIERYQKEIFEFDPKESYMIPSVVKPDDLLSKMDASNDFISAKALFEAYKDLPPVIAASKEFWAYLTHVDLYSYIRNRHPKLKEVGFNDGKYVNEHLFYGFGGPIYHPLQGLWWSVKMTIDDACENPYKYTEYLFKDYGLRVTYFGRYKMFRNSEQVKGILDFMMEHEIDLFSEHFRQKSRWIVQHFNKIGATKQLIALDREYFKSELEKVKNVIVSIKSDEDVKNL